MSTDEKPQDAASDDLKRKFKEALEKKNAHHRSGEAHLNGDSAVHATQGPAGAKRTFRRKSG
jgi:hypothetical protein